MSILKNFLKFFPISPFDDPKIPQINKKAAIRVLPPKLRLPYGGVALWQRYHTSNCTKSHRDCQYHKLRQQNFQTHEMTTHLSEIQRAGPENQSTQIDSIPSFPKSSRRTKLSNREKKKQRNSRALDHFTPWLNKKFE